MVNNAAEAGRGRLVAAEQAACARIDELREELEQLALYLHANPELGLTEVKAAAAVGDLFRRHDFTVVSPIPEAPSLPTALRADGKNLKKGPSIAFLGEYDALPELGHGCGHNLIAMMSAGAALGFQAGAGDAASASFFGCLAEETVGGKIFMAKAGLFRGYRGALILHPGGATEVGGSSLASHPLEVVFHGRSAHVASRTDRGINALDALMAFYQAVRTLEKSFTDYALIGMIVTEGGAAPNIIPDRAAVHMTVRAETVAYLEDTVLPAVRSTARQIAADTGTKVDMCHYEPLFKDLRQDPVLNKLMLGVMGEFGEEPVILPEDDAEGSTDVGNVSYEVPTIQPSLSIGADLHIHTPEFAQAAASPYGLDQAIKGAKIMAVTALRYVLL